MRLERAMFLCERAVSLREALGLSRSDLHRAMVRAGYNGCRAQINRWERGDAEPSVREVVLLATALHRPVTDLLSGLESTPPEEGSVP